MFRKMVDIKSSFTLKKYCKRQKGKCETERKKTVQEEKKIIRDRGNWERCNGSQRWQYRKRIRAIGWVLNWDLQILTKSTFICTILFGKMRSTSKPIMIVF